MNDAAVGFQCPSCVAEGRKATRSGRTPYGGLRPTRGGVVSQVLIAINAAVWLVILATGATASVWVDRLSLRPAALCVYGRGVDVNGTHALCTATGGTWLPGVSDGAWWQLVTSMFTQVAVLHIGINMLFLWILGPQLELLLGRVRYLGLYLLAGLVGSAAVYWLSPEFSPTLGASGAIFGLMGALLVFALKAHADVSQLMMWIGLNIAFTFFGTNISWQGHLGGFFGGIVLALILAYAPRARRTAWQASGFGVVFALVVVAVVTRTAMLT
ncbi:MAG: rhomboid family intramembrane serine protease [Nocardioides sp.]